MLFILTLEKKKKIYFLQQKKKNNSKNKKTMSYLNRVLTRFNLIKQGEVFNYANFKQVKIIKKENLNC